MESEDDQKHPVDVTREELYRQVWQTPMSRLAAEYGISGNGLAKICDRLNIPYPPRGYWAKRAAGKKVVTYRLPPADESTVHSVTISPTPPPAPPPKLPPKIQEKLDDAQTKVASLVVSGRLTKPHPLIARWLDEHERQKAEARRERDPWRRSLIHPGEFTPQDRRRHRILDALFKELERNGGKVKENDRRRLFVELSGEPIEFQLREKQKQVRRPLTDDEKRWRSSSDRDWKQVLEGTGRFVFSIQTYLDGSLRREWLESDAAPMERLLPEIVATLIAAGAVLVEKRRKREETERQRQIEEQRRAEERERRKLDDNRWRRLTELANAWRTAQVTREFITALKAMPSESQEAIAGQSLNEWLAWAEERLQKADPLAYGVDGIFGDVAQVTAWTYRD